MNTQLREELGALQGELMQREDQLGRFLKDIKRLEAINNELSEALSAILKLEGETVDANRYGTGDVERKVFGAARSAISKATGGAS